MPSQFERSRRPKANVPDEPEGAAMALTPEQAAARLTSRALMEAQERAALSIRRRELDAYWERACAGAAREREIHQDGQERPRRKQRDLGLGD
jgi:hypothetical protein